MDLIVGSLLFRLSTRKFESFQCRYLKIAWGYAYLSVERGDNVPLRLCIFAIISRTIQRRSNHEILVAKNDRRTIRRGMKYGNILLELLSNPEVIYIIEANAIETRRDSCLGDCRVVAQVEGSNVTIIEDF